MEIITINSKNINTYDHCLIKNTQADGYIAKSTWIKAELKNGLVIKRAINERGETMGFIEYISIENAWRAVKGKNYFFIHCVFTYPKKYQGQNIGTKLIQSCIDDANQSKQDGVAVIATKNSFMADKQIFEKMNFREIEEYNKHQLLVFKLNKKSIFPKLMDIDSSLKQYNGIHLFFSNQCPALAKPVKEILNECEKQKIKITTHFINSSTDAQNAPFISGTFGVVYNRKVYAERCISKTRFFNIIKQQRSGSNK